MLVGRLETRNTILVGNASEDVFILNCSTIPYAFSCPASVTVLAARDYKQDSRIAMDVMFDFDALDEVLSLADPYQAEPTSLANPC